MHLTINSEGALALAKNELATYAISNLTREYIILSQIEKTCASDLI